MRKKFMGGNWKMNGNKQVLVKLVEKMCELGIDQYKEMDIVVFPSFVYLDEIKKSLKDSVIKLGAQNQADQLQGAFTGEVSPNMLSDVGCEYVLLGHSERRHIYGETNEMIARKFKLANEQNLLPVLCVGETESERLQGQTEQVIAKQLESVIAYTGIESFSKAVIAYEPVWAIGTGRVAVPQDVQMVHQFIRAVIAKKDESIAQKIRIIYGGSLKPDNAAEIVSQADVDGGLIGGASLKAQDFVMLCQLSC